jgi:hypothetical protein
MTEEDPDKNELIQSLIRLRKRCCGGVSAASMTTNTRMAKDNAEFQKLIQGVKALIAERDEARRLYCIAFQEITENLGEKNTTESIAEEMGWDCFKENTNAQE